MSFSRTYPQWQCRTAACMFLRLFHSSKNESKEDLHESAAAKLLSGHVWVLLFWFDLVFSTLTHPLLAPHIFALVSREMDKRLQCVSILSSKIFTTLSMNTSLINKGKCHTCLIWWRCYSINPRACLLLENKQSDIPQGRNGHFTCKNEPVSQSLPHLQCSLQPCHPFPSHCVVEARFASNAVVSNSPLGYWGQYYCTSQLVILPELVDTLYSQNPETMFLVIHYLVCTNQKAL